MFKRSHCARSTVIASEAKQSSLAVMRWFGFATDRRKRL
jgi:hypothetical protein